MLNRFAIAILATAVLAPAILISSAVAQIRTASGTIGIAARPAPGGRGGFVRSGVAGGAARFRHEHSSGRGSILFPYPYYYSDFGYDFQGAAEPQVVVVPAAVPPVQTPPAAPVEPLLIEWQGDHFERMTLSQKASASGQSAPDFSEKSTHHASTPGSSAPGSLPPARKVAAQPPRELPPAVLVFRDGRTEEVSSYTIMSGTIYSRTDYWASGSWTKKIQIADLDVPATLKLNHEHGLTFVLPASPNEVVMRP